MKGLQNMSYKKEKTPKILLDNKSICILPWIHTSVKPNSEAKPCCRFQHYLPEHKDIKKVNVIDYKTPQEILNSDAYKNLREKMLRGMRLKAKQNTHFLVMVSWKSRRETVNLSSFQRISNTIKIKK